jgi:hypothetical protein
MKNEDIKLIFAIFVFIFAIILFISFIYNGLNKNNIICNEFNYSKATDKYNDFDYIFIECDNQYILEYKCQRGYTSNKWGVMKESKSCWWEKR